MHQAVKLAIEALLTGGIVVQGNRVLDADKKPVARLTNRQYNKIYNLLRRHKQGLTINKNKVRQLNGHTYIKKAYKLINSSKPAITPEKYCHPCVMAVTPGIGILL